MTMTATKPVRTSRRKSKPAEEAAKSSAVTLPARGFLALLNDCALFASTDTSRPVLRCIQIEASQDTLTAQATDSYVLIEATEPAVVEKPWTRHVDRGSVPLLRSLLANSREEKVTIVVKDDDPGLTIARGMTSVTVGTTPPTNWPDISGLLAKQYKAGKGEVNVNPALLALLARLSDKPYSGARLRHHDINEPIEWSLGDRRRGLIMPLRVNR